MGRKEQPECDYCDGPIGDDYVWGDGFLYCSDECRYAGRTKCWALMLLIMVPFSILIWTGIDYNIEILLFLAASLLLIIFLAREMILGIRARRRVAKKRKLRELRELG